VHKKILVVRVALLLHHLVQKYTRVSPASQASQLLQVIFTKAHKGKMALICPVPELPNGWVMISAGWL
jgi:hypothetical protein